MIEVDDSALSDDQVVEVEALVVIEQWRRLAITDDGPSELLRRLKALGWEYVEDKCSGDCLTAADVGVAVSGDPVAYGHPDCPVHGASA